jgi:hypothetical protein
MLELLAVMGAVAGWCLILIVVGAMWLTSDAG